jgi:hypothetical protein
MGNKKGATHFAWRPPERRGWSLGHHTFAAAFTAQRLLEFGLGDLSRSGPGRALAAYNVGGDFGNGYMLRWNGQSWHAVGGGLPNNVSFKSVVVPDLLHVYAASNTNVYSSHDFGDSWQIASDGLPLVAQSTGLHVVTQGDGKRYLHLATKGWSLWRAELK